MAKPFKMKSSRCVRVATGSVFDFNARTLSGRKLIFVVCPIRNGVQIRRAGRRGGVRSVDKARGGITMCTAAGVNSKCLRAKDFVAFPGGGSKLKRGGTAMLNGYSKMNRRVRRIRRGSKRRG